MSELKCITLPGTDITTTAAGFGCSGLLGDKTPEEGTHLLHTAYEAGIRHFDVARYYGYGDAEGLVGAFTQGKRDRVTITTKFGMQPMKQVAQFNGVMRFVRQMMRLSPVIRGLVRRKVSALVQKGRFDVASAQESLETSLRELKTDYIDVYLLHEGDSEDCQTPELLDFLQQSYQQGKIRSFGVGGAYSRVEAICRTAPDFAAVTQFDSQLFADNVRHIPGKDLRNGSSRALITFGAFSALSRLREQLNADPALAAQCTEILEADVGDSRVLSGLILQQALYANPHGIAIFRSARPENITQNIRALSENPFSQEALKQFSLLFSARSAPTLR